MDRRNFLQSLVGGVAVGAAVRSWPFRVFSFPTEIVLPATNIFKGDFATLLAPGLRQIFIEYLDEQQKKHPEYYTKIFDC